jgi:mRNA-degrading endonuclease HigB of HigAB toxin-antitoxin module
MHIITRKRLNDFAEKYPEAQSALHRWYKLMKSRNFNSFGVFPVRVHAMSRRLMYGGLSKANNRRIANDVTRNFYIKDRLGNRSGAV